MLSITTGLPGHGKTLYTLGLVEQQRLDTGRTVYYVGVPELTLPWIQFPDVEEPKPGEPLQLDWSKIPDGSIVFIDEAWKPFPVRKQGSKVPGYVEFLATHRHHALDIWLVTQHHQQLDTFVRKLIERHYHVSRKFGSKRVTIYQWEKVTDPSSEKEQKDALVKRWKYDESRYAWYRSAFAHTRSGDFPMKMIAMIAGLVLLLGGLIAFTLHSVKASGAKAQLQQTTQQGTGITSSQRWAITSVMPRVEGSAWTAPIYDEVNKVKSSPRPVGCMQLVINTDVKCICSTDQGTDAGVATQQCMRYIKTGIYDAARKDEDRKAINIEYLNRRDAPMASTTGAPEHAATDSGS